VSFIISWWRPSWSWSYGSCAISAYHH